MILSTIVKGFFVSLFLVGTLGFGIPKAKAETANSLLKSKNIQVIYFSKTGNTKKIAEYIHDIVGGDIVEITAKSPYPEDYDETTELAKKEKDEGIFPEIHVDTSNLESAEVVFLGSPCWFSDISSPVKTFLKEHDLAGKTIVPFITHGGSGIGEETISTIKEMCPNATVLDGQAFGDPRWVSVLDDQKPEVQSWLETLQ